MFKQFPLCFLLLAILFDGAAVNGQQWKTGSGFRKALNKEIQVSANGQIRDELSGIQESTGVSIWLDREIDPHQKVAFPSQLMPLGQLLDLVAQAIDSKAVYVGSTVCILPERKARSLLILRSIQSHQVSRFDRDFQRNLQRTASLKWSLLAEPKQILKQVADQVDLSIEESVPILHDLWPAKTLPPMTRLDQMTLLLNAMNQAYLIDEPTKKLRVIRLSENHQLNVPFRSSLERKINAFIKSNNLKVTTTKQGSTLFVRGSFRDQLALAEVSLPVRKWKVDDASGKKSVFDLETTASRGSVLASIAKNQKVELKIQPDTREILSQEVKLKLKQVTVEMLIEEVLKGTGLTFKLDDESLSILPD